MTPLCRHLPALIASLALVAVPTPSLAESMLITGGETAGASASLNFRIIIPPMMKVMENSHPVQLTAGADGDLSAEQRLVVLSTMKRGFCVTLRLATASASPPWKMATESAAPAPGATTSCCNTGSASTRQPSRPCTGRCRPTSRRSDAANGALHPPADPTTAGVPG